MAKKSPPLTLKLSSPLPKDLTYIRICDWCEHAEENCYPGPSGTCEFYKLRESPPGR